MSGVALDALDAPDRLNQPEPSWRREARLVALDWLAVNPMPTRRDEAWRYTAVDDLMTLLAGAVRPRQSFDLAVDEIDALAGDHGGPRLVLVNGTYAPTGSRHGQDPGVRIGTFSALTRDPAAGPALEPARLDGFVALNCLAGDDGASIRVAAGAAAAGPIHVVHVAAPDPGATLITHPNTVIQIEPGAHATVIESYVGLTGPALTNAATTIDVGDRATLAYHRVQTETAGASHVGHVRIRTGHDASVHATSLSIGAAIARVAFDISADGDRSTIEVDGLYLPADRERHDHVVTVEHLGSHTSSTQRFKGVIDDRARGSFTGQVIVRPGTVDTSADQTNHSLLLTPTAESDTRPWLEILADDVRCTHGATIGRLDDQALHYLRTRGIPLAAARRMLIEAFTGEIVESIGVASLRDHLAERIDAKRRGAEGSR